MEVMAGSSSRPLLSGFYRMMAVVLRLAEEGAMLSQDSSSGAVDTGQLAFNQVCSTSAHPEPHNFACCIYPRRSTDHVVVAGFRCEAGRP